MGDAVDVSPSHESKPPWELDDLSSEDSDRLSAEHEPLQASLRRIHRWAAANPDVGAGVWLDNTQFRAGDGRVRIGVGVVENRLPDAQAALLALMDDPTRLVVVPKRWSEQRLRAVQQDIQSKHCGPAHAYRVVGLGVDLHTNEVHVALEQDDPAFAESLRTAYEPVPVRVVVRKHPTAPRW